MNEHSAIFGQGWLVRITYNTDQNGAWVADDDYSNITLHGPFDTVEEAQEWMNRYPDGDRDLKDMDAICFNKVKGD